MNKFRCLLTEYHLDWDAPVGGASQVSLTESEAVLPQGDQHGWYV